MARYTGPKRRLSRREGVALFPKDEKALERKGAMPPGQHGQRGKRKTSEYGLQLREKQKAKRIYGILERQFRLYFAKASKQKGVTGETLLRLLETRLDNVLYRLGFAPSRQMARQLVAHGHVLVSGKKINIPSYQTKPGEVISFKGKALEIPAVRKELAETKNENLPQWLEKKAAVGRIVRLPQKEDIEVPISEELIVEHYSR